MSTAGFSSTGNRERGHTRRGAGAPGRTAGVVGRRRRYSEPSMGSGNQSTSSSSGSASCGGGRGRWGRGGSAGSPRWKRMRRATSGSSTTAIKRSRPSQRPHWRASTRKARRKSLAQSVRRGRAGASGGSTTVEDPGDDSTAAARSVAPGALAGWTALDPGRIEEVVHAP